MRKQGCRPQFRQAPPISFAGVALSTLKPPRWGRPVHMRGFTPYLSGTVWDMSPLILSDNLPGKSSTFFLTCCLTNLLTFFLALRHSFWHSFWHVFPTVFWRSFWYSFLLTQRAVSHSVWHIFRRSLRHSGWLEVPGGIVLTLCLSRRRSVWHISRASFWLAFLPLRPFWHAFWRLVWHSFSRTSWYFF